MYTNLYHAIRGSDTHRSTVTSGNESNNSTAIEPDVLAIKPQQFVDVIKLIELGMQSSREGRVVNVA